MNISCFSDNLVVTLPILSPLRRGTNLKSIRMLEPNMIAFVGVLMEYSSLLGQVFSMAYLKLATASTFLYVMFKP